MSPSYGSDRLPLANSNNLKILPGQPILQMLTVDSDEENTPNSQVLYFLISQTPLLKESGFEINRESGEIRLLGCLDYEVMWILFQNNEMAMFLTLGTGLMWHWEILWVACY